MDISVLTKNQEDEEDKKETMGKWRLQKGTVGLVPKGWAGSALLEMLLLPQVLLARYMPFVNPLKPDLSNYYTLPYSPNLPFLISDIRALWRSALSARVPECQKLKTVG